MDNKDSRACLPPVVCDLYGKEKTCFESVLLKQHLPAGISSFPEIPEQNNILDNNYATEKCD